MNEWFNHPEWWFSGDQYDQVIIEKFGHLIEYPDKIMMLTPIEKIIVYDQIPRHIYRKEQSNHIVLYFLEKALQVNIDVDELDDIQFCFAMLPNRHTLDYEKVKLVMKRTWERIKLRDSPILHKFLKATYDRCPLQGANQKMYTGFDKNILHFCPYESATYSNECLKLPMVSNKKIVLSTSGGSDSMLCTWLFANQYPRDKLVVLHINYGNRETSDEEEKFVGWWCDQLGLLFYARKISEIYRKPCMEYGLRSLYETYTRNVRYHCYKEFDPCLVVLGHNHDDVIENVFTNIAKSSKYDNLDGMTEFSIVDGISFWRPLLQMSKDDIVKWCTKMNIPYLPNSTPTWSMRGQIRNKVVPCLDEWNDQFVKGLEKLSTHFKDLYGMMESLVDEVARKAIVTETKISFDVANVVTNHLFWRTLFARLNIQLSQRSLDNLLKQLHKKEFQVVLNKDTKCFMKSSNQIYHFEVVLLPSVL